VFEVKRAKFYIHYSFLVGEVNFSNESSRFLERKMEILNNKFGFLYGQTKQALKLIFPGFLGFYAFDR
jgi:hypothetical protein